MTKQRPWTISMRGYWAVALLPAMLACEISPEGASPPPTVVMSLRADASFWDFPFPSDLRREADGKLDLRRFPNPASSDIVDRSVEYLQEHRGFGVLSTVYFRIDGPVRFHGLAKDELQTQQPPTYFIDTASTAPMFLVDIDAHSPEFGTRRPLNVRQVDTASGYGAAGLLAVAPSPGFPLRPKTRYAAGIVRDAAGSRLRPDTLWALIAAGAIPPKETDPSTGESLDLWVRPSAVAAHYRDAITTLAEMDIKASDLAALTLFTTDDSQEPLATAHEQVTRDFTLGNIAGRLTRTREYADYCVLTGTVPMPQFQRGMPLYFDGTGDWARDEEGRLLQQRIEDVPVAVSIPKGNMPAEGWPLTIYIHGTGGESTQFIDRSRTDEDHRTVDGDGPAAYYAARGLAMAGAALPINPQRFPANAGGFAMYNFFEPKALLDNLRQGAIEQALWMRAIRAARFDASICPGSNAAAAADGKIFFRQDRLAGTGQSLGSMELAMWSTLEDAVGAVVPTGAGAYWGIILPLLEALPGDPVFRTVFGLDPANILDPLHPFFAMTQWLLEPIDPATTVHRWIREPRAGVQAKHVFYPAGVFDEFFPPPSESSYALIAGLAPVAEDDKAPVFGQTWSRFGIAPLTLPQSDNLETTVDGVAQQRTAVMSQYREDGILRGHHVVFQLNEPKYQIGCFVRDYFDGRSPVVRPGNSDPLAACP